MGFEQNILKLKMFSAVSDFWVGWFDDLKALFYKFLIECGKKKFVIKTVIVIVTKIS